MKKISMAVALLMAVSLFAGCQNDDEMTYGGPEWGDRLATPAETHRERNLRLRQITILQLRMITDDWDNLWLYDRSSRLTRWYVDVGH